MIDHILGKQRKHLVYVIGRLRESVAISSVMGDRHLQNSDPAKSRLQRLIQDIAHLVLDYHTSRMLALRIPSQEGEQGYHNSEQRPTD